MQLQPTTELESVLSSLGALRASANTSPNDSELQQKAFGTEREMWLAQRMLGSLSGMFCYHNFEGQYRDSRFEIDFLLLTSAGKALLVEVKGYKGLYDLCPHDAYLLDKIDKGVRTRQVKNPVPQLARAKRLLEEMLSHARIPCGFEAVVVFTDDFWPSKPLLNSFFGQGDITLTTPNEFISYLQSLTISPFFPNNPLSQLVNHLYYQEKKSPIFFDPFFFSNGSR